MLDGPFSTKYEFSFLFLFLLTSHVFLINVHETGSLTGRTSSGLQRVMPCFLSGKDRQNSNQHKVDSQYKEFNIITDNIHSQNYTLPWPALYGVQGWSLKTAKLCRKRKLEVFSLGLFGNPQISELMIFVKFTLYTYIAYMLSMLSSSRPYSHWGGGSLPSNKSTANLLVLFIYSELRRKWILTYRSF